MTETEAWLEALEERAAILEFDAGMTRKTANVAAAQMVAQELGPMPGDVAEQCRRHT